MPEYPSPHRCGACDAPAVFRFALCAPDERPAAALERRALYRCPACFPVGKADYVAGGRLDAVDWLFVVDAVYTRQVVAPLCDCGLPADHRTPLSGEPRPCADETERIAIPGRSSRPPVRAATAPVLPLRPNSVTGDESPDETGTMRHGIGMPEWMAKIVDRTRGDEDGEK